MLKIIVYHSYEKRFEDISSKYTCDLEKGNGNEMVQVHRVGFLMRARLCGAARPAQRQC